MGRFHKALPNVKSAYVTLLNFTPDLQKIYTDISAVSVTLCNSDSRPKTPCHSGCWVLGPHQQQLWQMSSAHGWVGWNGIGSVVKLSDWHISINNVLQDSLRWVLNNQNPVSVELLAWWHQVFCRIACDEFWIIKICCQMELLVWLAFRVHLN